MYPSALSTSSTLARIFEPGVEALGLARICGLRMRVMRSLSGSCVDMSDPPYQLDFTSPGTRPLEPSSRSAMRLSLFLRYTERGRPVISQRLRIRVADELRGSSASFSIAANRSSIGFLLSGVMGFRLRPLRELQHRREPLFHRLLLVGDDGLQLRALGRGLLGHPLAPVVLLDRTLL